MASTCTAGLALALIPWVCAGQGADALQDWIAKTAVSVRSVDAADEDFSDLEPLVAVIGGRRVVQLGEVSHGAGSHFAAKVRLIKFLHKRMGFDVVLWESGMYSLTLTEAALRAGGDPMAAGLAGIFPLWSSMEEVQPLFVYAQASRGTSLPLEMAGFDMQFSSVSSADQFGKSLRAFIQAAPDADLRARALGFAGEALTTFRGFSRADAVRETKYADLARQGLSSAQAAETMASWEEGEGMSLAPRPGDLERFQLATQRLVELMRSRRELFLRVHSARTADFMARAVENFGEQGVSTYELHAADRPKGDASRPYRNRSWNRRDTQNAATLRWMIDDYYRDRKIVLWAHNGHVMNACYAADWKTLHDTPQPGGMKPSGSFLKDWYGEGVYSVGFTAYAGREKHMFRDESLSVQPATAGSLEDRLHRLGKPFLFVDFSSASDVAAHPLRQPQAMRIRATAAPETMPDLTRVYDAVFFVDSLAPATRRKPAAPQPAS